MTSRPESAQVCRSTVSLPGRASREAALRGVAIALGLVTVSCAAQRPPEPAWSPQPPPPYPAPHAQVTHSTNVAPASAPPSAKPASIQPASLQEQYGARPAIETFTGKATYYADSLAGNRTASGETYDPKYHSAAHKKLPFGTVVRVVRQDTGATTYARVNDRGPFGSRDRIIDLSRAAAEDLEMLRAGVVPVRVEVVSRPD